MKLTIANFLKRNHLLLNVIGVYLLASIIIFPLFRYVLNPDGVSYINVAKKYLSGNFQLAINGYWSPLFSWLLIPFLALKVDGLLATKLLSIITGVFLLLGVNRLLVNQKIRDIWRAWALFTIIPLLLMFTFTVVTPDLLLCVMLINYLNSLLDKNFVKYKDQAITVGWFGALAYLAKSYALIFFLVHFSFSVALFYRRYKLITKKRFILSQWLIGIFIFVLISGTWTILISKKYHHLTFSTAAKFNQQKTAKEVDPNPNNITGLIEPADKFSTSYWDDPSNIQLTTQTNKISVENITYRLKLIFQNIIKTIVFYNYLSIFTIAIILISIFIYSRKIYIRKHIILLMLLLYPIWYWPILIEERYLWTVFVLVIVLSAGLLDYWQSHNKLSKLVIFITAFIVFISFQYLPWETRHMKKPGNELVLLSSEIKSNGTNRERVASIGNYPDSLSLAYYSNKIYLGELGLGLSNEQLNKLIIAHKIDYLWIWRETNNQTPGLIINKVR